MNCNIKKSTLRGIINCPQSKSYTHRAIFLATLVKNDASTIINPLNSSDIDATIKACLNFGATVSKTKNAITIFNNKFQIKSEIINAKNSGTTIRFASAISSLFDKLITLTGDDSLKKRPMSPILQSLRSLGARCSSCNGKPPLKIEGRISGGKTTIVGRVSSQFISALLIIAPLLKDGLTIIIENNLISKQYVDATIATMKQFGITTKTISKYKKYHINFQKYVPTTFYVPSDFSSLALLLSTAVLVGNKLNIKISQNDLPQGDKIIIKILNMLGVNVMFDENIISVRSPNQLNGGKFDLSNNPDLLPPLALLALKSSKPIEIFNVRHARYKEADRLSIISREFKKVSLLVEEKDDGIILQNTGNLKGAHFNPENDHRLFMTFCVAGMYIGECTISDRESIDVSYPNFLRDVCKVGGNISNIDM
ncbi:MAG: 3-phosphoshikimate 1-carboxyvinyltransferase [Thaumarchaeota archaeon]|nr:3-phosphoshikimate 1-carboxyvinyltransferase [Nitrososphaerota archaeon]MCY3976283.1 3-phosphoshikimate 1-carboxyvinyltransferase [Nitrososphaerota archaeon]